MVELENPNVLKDFVRAQAGNPMLRKIRDDRFIYQSHDDFGPVRSPWSFTKIADFGVARQDDPQFQNYPIQPDHYRAPEVILGAGRTYSADNWNLGIMV